MVVARGGMREVTIWRESNLKKDSLFKLTSFLQHPMAAKQGDLAATYFLAEAYEKGEGAPEDGTPACTPYIFAILLARIK